MKVFLIAYLLNVKNLEPVVIRDCVEIDIKNSKAEALKQIEAFGTMDLKCEQLDDAIAYACISKKRGLIGRITVLKDIKECKAHAAKTSRDMKNLLGR